LQVKALASQGLGHSAEKTRVMGEFEDDYFPLLHREPGPSQGIPGEELSVGEKIESRLSILCPHGDRNEADPHIA
jgi:hypothetical protein